MAPKWKYLNQPFPEHVRGSLEERFNWIFQNRYWEETESISGPGSSLDQTARLILELPALLRALEVTSVLDIPCGDFHWMSRADLTGIQYVGGEIVEELVRSNRKRFGSPSREFFHLDMTRDSLPRVDLILCRDGLVHLSYADIEEALSNFRSRGAVYLLTTTFPEHAPNRDIVSGDWRPLNFQIPPFSWDPPQWLLVEGCPEDGFHDKSLGLWRI